MLHSFIAQWNIVAAAVWAALFNSLPAVCIVTGCVWLLLDRVKGWSAAMRYAGWCAILALAIGLPVVQFAIPHPRAAAAATASAKDVVKTEYPAPAMTTLDTALNRAVNPAVNPAVTSMAASHDESGFLTEAPAAPAPNHFWGLTAGGGLLLLWVAAMLVQIVRLGMALRCNVVLKRSAFAPDDEVAGRWADLLRGNPDVKRPVRLALSSSITMPAVVGYRRPLVLLPETLAAQLSGDELDGILLHELAHVRRWDDWAIAGQRFVQAVFAVHPLVHLIASKMELQREIACDDWVLRTQQARVYASSLTSVAEFCLRPAHSGLMGLAMERPSQLGERVELLLDNTRPVMTRISMRWLSGLVSALGLAGVLSLQLPEVMAFPVQENAEAVPVTKSHAATKLMVLPATAGPVPVDLHMTVDPHVPTTVEISPVQVDSVKAPLVAVTPHTMTHVVADPEIADERLSEDHELSDEQRQQIRKQMEAARQQMEKSRVQMGKQLHEQLQPQMRQLREQLSHMDMNRMINDSVRAQMQVGQMEAQAAMSRALAELSRDCKGAQLTQAQRDKIQAERNRYQAQMAQLRAEQEKTAREFSDRINAIVNEAMKQALQQPKK